MRIFIRLFIILATVLVAACSDDDGMNISPTGSISNNSVNSDTSGDDLEDFDIDLDSSVLEEEESIPTDESDADYDDFVENSEFSQKIYISYNEGNTSVSGSIDGVVISVDDGHVTVISSIKGVEYVLDGETSDGSLKVYCDYKFLLTLNGVNITNPSGAAINIQSGKRVFVCLEDGTSNYLKDGSSYVTTDGEDMKGCFFSEGQLLFSGSGFLSVTGYYKHGICSDDYIRFRAGNNIMVSTSVGNGIKANDAIIIGGGVINVETTGTASKGLSCDGYMLVSGGRTTVITSGGGEYEDGDVSGCAGIKCDSVFTMTGGVIALKSTGNGGKGLNCDQDINISDGTIYVITSGKQYTYGNLDTSSKGIKSDECITISDGYIKIRTSGGEGSEGIESKDIMTINGGTLELSSYDDCLNASNGININGGYIYAYSSTNDGIDSNGYLNISGGTIVAVGASTPEGGIDSDEGILSVTGGTIIGIGGSNSRPSASASTQPTVVYSGNSITSGTSIALLESDGTSVLTYEIPRSYSGTLSLIMSSSSLERGTSYTLSSGGTTSGGDSFHGLTINNTWSGGSQISSFTISSMVTTTGNSTSQFGGNVPNSGRW